MQDYYEERLRPWYRHRSQLGPASYHYFEDGHEERLLSSLQRQLVQAFRPSKYESEEDSEDENDVEKATRAHMKATLEYDKAKEKSDEANKKLEECELRVQAAARELERAKKEDFEMGRTHQAPQADSTTGQVGYVPASCHNAIASPKTKMRSHGSKNAARSDSSTNTDKSRRRSGDQKDKHHPEGENMGRSESAGHHLVEGQPSARDRHPSCDCEAGADNGEPRPSVADGLNTKVLVDGKTDDEETDRSLGGPSSPRNTQVAFILLRHYSKLREQAMESSETIPTDPCEVYKLKVVFVIEDFFDQVPELRDEGSSYKRTPRHNQKKRNGVMVRTTSFLRKIGSGTQHSPCSFLQHQLSRKIHAATDLTKATSVKESQSSCNSVLEAETLPEHVESHAGPYGVEMPLQWEFIVTVTQRSPEVEGCHEKKHCLETPRDDVVHGEGTGKTK
ncbi:hypothetical protein OPT61_g5640 [Boeremia exigua]|uniref:Uncharacterized protein n=1 Tax=Boeremia exigua TaxID=749465 RepID=A0ACC2I9J9_9PLEO|nr:hypothetical protein OPT61_g5640 [Boeremia exigua]